MDVDVMKLFCLLHFLENIITEILHQQPNINEIQFFYDSCTGQNKNPAVSFNELLFQG